MDQSDTMLTASITDRLSTGPADRFAFIQSCWHRVIVDRGRDGFLAEMARQGVPNQSSDIFEVAGVFEIPLLAKKLARSNRYRAIVACGLIVDGGIYRHDFVSSAVINALMAVQLETEIPVISAVLTPQQFHEHDEHRRFFKDHFITKGKEAATACLMTVKTLRRVQAMSS
jgi:6,7-dimethyl-8-ribityllumazine synthase